jgi:hypothetical protein
MSNLIETIPMIGVRGDVLIETRDAKTGKIAQRSEGHNLFTNYGLERFRKYCAMGIGGQFGKNAYFQENTESEVWSATNASSWGFLKNLILTDNAAAVAATDRRVPGNLTGFATRYPYAGANITQGSINMTETRFTKSGIKTVFDFATDKGNGTHRSVFWADGLISAYNNYASFEDPGFAYSPARTYSNFAESNDGYFYGNVGSTLYKIDPTTFAEVATYTLPAAPSSSGIFDVTDGICVFTPTYGSTTLYVFTLADSSNITKTLPGGSTSYCYGGGLVNGILYYAGGNDTVYAYNIAAGTYTSKAPSGVGTINVCLRCGTTLAIMGGNASAKCSFYDYATNTATGTECYTPVDRVDGQSACNTYSLTGKLWHPRKISCYGSDSIYSVYAIHKLDLNNGRANMITGKLLDAPITKDNTQTMKVTYTISFV